MRPEKKIYALFEYYGDGYMVPFIYALSMEHQAKYYNGCLDQATFVKWPA